MSRYRIKLSHGAHPSHAAAGAGNDAKAALASDRELESGLAMRVVPIARSVA